MASKKLICTVGLPRAGKSTWAIRTNSPVVNPDSIRVSLHGQSFAPGSERFVWAIAHAMVEALFLAGHTTVILDATNVSEKRRSEWKHVYCLDDMVTTELKIFDTSPKECVMRATAGGRLDLIPVIERMAKEWDLPRPEGWDI